MVKFLGMGGKGIDYEIGAIAEDLNSPEEMKSERSLDHLKTIEEKFSEFENDLKTKGKRVPTDEEFFDAYRRAVEVLRNYFDSKGSKVKRLDAHIHHFYLDKSRKDFRKIYGESAEE